jgi:uncharacterized lipoprotein
MKRSAKALFLALALVWVAGCGTPQEPAPTNTVMPATPVAPTADPDYPGPELSQPTTDPNYPGPQTDSQDTLPGSSNYPEPEE